METKVLNAVSLIGTVVPHPRDPLTAGFKKITTRKNPVFSTQCFDPPSLMYAIEHLGVMQREFGDRFTLSKRIRWENPAFLYH